VGTLRRKLHDPTRLVRVQAVVALAKIGDRGSVDALLKYIDDGSPDGRWLARLAVLHLSSDRRHHEPLCDMLGGSRRRDAALVLAQLKDARAAPALYQLISTDRDRRVWYAARQLGDPTLDRLVLRRLRQDLRLGRLTTLDRTLDYAGPARVKGLTLPLLDLLFRRWGAKRGQRRVTYRDALLSVLRSLGYSGAGEVRPWLDHFTRHDNYHVRTEARLAQALLGRTEAARRLIVELVGAADHHRPYLVRVLGRLPRSVVEPLVKPLWGRNDPFFALALAAVLYRTEAGTTGPGFQRLLQGLRSPQATVRRRAMTYLTQDMTAARRRTLEHVRRVERDAMARDALAQVTERYRPPLEMFGVFRPHQVILR
jgi:hypothetical protein